MTVNETIFGAHKGQDVQLYTLKNDKGMVVKVTNYGATITSIMLPNSHGVIEEISCGFDTLNGYFSEAYRDNAPYFGGTVGRYCSQIKKSKFSLDGQEYFLENNCGNNNLHGGIEGFNSKIWKAKQVENPNGASVKMSLISMHLEEGFPGKVTVSVSFTLTNDNELKIVYHAITGRATPFTITNHTYFNLSGFKSTVEDHSVKILSSNKLEMDNSGAATGCVVNLDGAVDDLRASKTIKEVHEAMSDGFEHYYIFDKNNFELEKVAEFTCNESGRIMEVSSSEPGMLFYTGKYTSNDLKRENGLQYGKYKGFCCETHRYPNGPNIDASPKSILNKGDVYNSTTEFKFSW